jgi:NADH-quinone oxidoreductase subunit M
MFSHGVIAGLLFAVVGRMVYERTHTRRLSDLRLLPLYRLLPFAATVFVVAGLASMGFPGFSGFPAELSILTGAWQASPTWAAVAALGVLIAAAFTLRVIQLTFFGKTGEVETPAHSGAGATGLLHGRESPAHPAALPPITWPERAGAILLISAAVVIGLKPDLLLNWIVPSLQSPLFRAVIKGGAP